MTLRIVSSRAPYRRAGVNFEPTGHKTIVATEVALGDLDAARLDALLADPHLDVTAGNGLMFGPVGSVEELADLAAMLHLASLQPGQVEPAKGTAEILADHHRIELERGRDAAAPGGDDEGAGDQASTDTTGAASGAPPAPPPKQPRRPAKKG